MTDPELCPKCGKRLPEDAPTGLCPSCLLAAVFAVPEPDGQPLSAMPSIGHPDTEQRGIDKSLHVADTDMAIPQQENTAQPMHFADLSPFPKSME